MKAPEAFRSISEVSNLLSVPQHTLRFWETKLSFIRPVQRSDGRRYYRPDDVAQLTAVSQMVRVEKKSYEEIAAYFLAKDAPAKIKARGRAEPILRDVAASSLKAVLLDLVAARERLKVALALC